MIVLASLFFIQRQKFKMNTWSFILTLDTSNCSVIILEDISVTIGIPFVSGMNLNWTPNRKKDQI